MGEYLNKLKGRARSLKADVYALYLAYHDPGVPWYARVVVAFVVAYALSPIDLIPDPIPVLGYLDDLIILPAGIALAVKLVPTEVMADCRKRAQEELAGGKKPVSRGAAVVIIALWIVLFYLITRVLWRLWDGAVRN